VVDDSRNLPVLAGPEQRRQLRELLAMPKGSWTAAQRQRYGELVQWEYLEYLKNLGDIALDVEREQRQGLVNFLSRPGQPQPVVQRIDATMPSEGEVLRDRNRRIREAREAFDGHTVAALEGRIAECIVCGAADSHCRNRGHADRCFLVPVCHFDGEQVRPVIHIGGST